MDNSYRNCKDLPELLAWCKAHGIKITAAKNKLHDFAAMNPVVAKKMGYKGIKDNELHIDESQPPDKIFTTIVHEFDETNDMKANKKPYWPAHVKALKREKKPPRKFSFI